MTKNTSLKHIAIIPDGNRRWAKEKGLAASLGHKKAAKFQRIKSFIQEAQKQNITHLTMWGFSTENWKRNKLEVAALMNLFENLCQDFLNDELIETIRYVHLGRKDRIPNSLANMLNQLETKTINNNNNTLPITFTLALDYGGEDELIRATNSLKNQKQEISSKNLIANLNSSRLNLPFVDLIIRTSGEQRLSGFMPLQSAYAELYFCQKHFPDFNIDDLKKAINWFYTRKRRFGGN